MAVKKDKLIGKISGIALVLVIVVVLAGLATLSSPILADDPVVTFPDAKLDAAIREAIGKPTGDIYQSDLEGLTSLDASGKSISDITGLEYCVNLTTLALYYNEISNISPLSSLTNLTELNLTFNRISNISPLSSLTNLTTLALSYNWLRGEFDITSLSSLTNLTILYLHGNSISDISPLSSLTNLTELVLGSNEILSNISPLANLTNLIELRLTDNQISDISPLVDNPGLGEGDLVWLINNPLSDDSINIYIPQLRTRGVGVSTGLRLST